MQKVTSVLLYLLVFLSISASCFAFENKSQNLDSGWQYRWGDSPVVQGQPLWITEDQDDQWKDIGFPSNPKGRNGRNNIWYRVTLPSEPDLGHSIFIYSIDLIAEVYFEGEMIYNYGHFKADGTGDFIGWPWHMVNLPQGYQGKRLYFRIYSDYPDIGLWGEVVLGSEISHLSKIIQGDLLAVGVGAFFIFFGLVLFILACTRLSGKIFLMGILLINLGLIPIGTSHLKQLLYFNPLGWQYFGAASYFLLPVTIAGLIQAMYGKGKLRVNQLAWIGHLLFLFVAISVSLLGFTSLSTTYLYFDALALVTFFLLALSLQLEARQGDTNKKLAAFSLWFMYGILVYNGLVAHDFLPFSASSEYTGPFFFILMMGVIMSREYSLLKQGLKTRTQELEELNLTLESRIKMRTQALALSNRSKDQFFAIIAHDLKGPVGSLAMLFQQFVKDKEPIPTTLLPEISRSVTGVFNLLENLLTWARGQKGELVAKPRHFELKDAIGSSIEITNGARVKKNITLEFEQEGQCYLFADLPMTTTIIRNYLNNAIKFTPMGGKITLSWQENLESVKVFVSDSGLGIPVDSMAHIFEMKEYGTLSQGTAGERGTGLGLPLCQDFSKLNGGTVGVTSKLGEGSTFWVSLPKGQATQQANEGTESEWFGKLRVLLVEDEKIPLQAALELLQSFGLKVDVASNGDAALELYKETRYNLIFMDIGLPHSDGVECLRSMEALKLSTPYKVALTSYTRAEMKKLFGETNFDRFISKPLSKNDLLDVLQETLAIELE